jgi:DNA helicase-2/ATP-dependent DNA helicase PcrA
VNRSAARESGTWYYRNVALHIINYAQGAFEGFDGEADFVLDAVDLSTVHCEGP